MRKFIVNVNGVDYDVEVRDGSVQEVKHSVQESAKTVAPEPVKVVSAPVQKREVEVNTPADNSGYNITAPMPGRIVKVNVSAGQIVRQGEVVIVLEAMKMQNEIKTPVDGTVSFVAVESGQTVKPGESMLVIA